MKCRTLGSYVNPDSPGSHQSLGYASVTSTSKISVVYNPKFYFLFMPPFHCEWAESAAPLKHPPHSKMGLPEHCCAECWLWAPQGEKRAGEGISAALCTLPRFTHTALPTTWELAWNINPYSSRMQRNQKWGEWQ